MGEYTGILNNAKGQSVNHDRRTICEVIRSLTDEAVVGLADKDPELLARMIPLIEEAYCMSIKLVKRLVELKIDDMELPFKYGTMPADVRGKIEKLRAERVRLMKILEAPHAE